jgi:hypothetical protein
MGFELGLTVARGHLLPVRHVWFVLESVNRRALKPLSDLAGTDVYIHSGTPEGVFREIGNAFARRKKHPTVQDVHYTYRGLQAALPGTLEQTGAHSRFGAHTFREILVAASEMVGRKLA